MRPMAKTTAAVTPYYWIKDMATPLNLPTNGPPNEVQMTYSFPSNNALIIGLDEDNLTAPQQVNQTWLNAQLAANTLPFTIIYGHYPAFSLGPSTESLSWADHPAARDAFWQSLADNSVPIYFCGHIHLYNRAEVSINGGPEIQQIVVGNGGAPLSGWDGTYPDPRVIPESHQEGKYGYDLVTVDGNTSLPEFFIIAARLTPQPAYGLGPLLIRIPTP